VPESHQSFFAGFHAFEQCGDIALGADGLELAQDAFVGAAVQGTVEGWLLFLANCSIG
jgi:hypothetical protein